MRSRFKLFLLCFYTCIISLGASPLKDSSQEIYSLNHEWSVYDTRKSAYVPFIRQVHRRTNQLHLSLTLKNYEGFYIKIRGMENSHVFLNNHLNYTFQKEEAIFLSVDSLQRYISPDSVCLITYYSLKSISTVPDVRVVLSSKNTIPINEDESVSSETATQHIHRKRSYNNDLRSMMKVISLIPLVIMILIWRFDNSSKLLLSRNQSDSFSKTGQVKRISSLSFISFMVYFSATLAFAVWFLADFSPWVTTEHLHLPPENLWEYGMSYIQLFLFFLFFVIVKYFIIQFMGVLYQDRQVSMIHLQQYINTAQFFCTLTAIFMCLSNFIAESLSMNLLNGILYVFCFLIVLKLVLMTVQLNKLVSYRKIYLFSYLCATEYILVILSIKFFTNL